MIPVPGERVVLIDQPFLDRLVASLRSLGFSSPKWSYDFNVPIKDLAPCSNRKFLCDVVAYRRGVPTVVFELDGSHHVEEKQERLDAQKERILMAHGVRLWRMWNGELPNIEGDAARLFRRDVKAHMYAPWGTLASDWKTSCKKCKKEE